MEEKLTPVQEVPRSVESSHSQAPISDIQTQLNVPTLSRPAGIQNSENISPTKRNKLILWIGLAVLLIFILCIASYLSISLRRSVNENAGTISNAIETPTSSPSPSWKSYSSITKGFSLQYPAEYEPPTEGENYFSLMSPLNPNRDKSFELQNGELKIEIYIEAATDDDSSLKCLNDHNPEEYKFISHSEMIIGGVNTTVYATEEYPEYPLICVIYNNKRYTISKYPAETTRQAEFDQILSSFKFIDQ